MTDLAIELEGVEKSYRFFELREVSLKPACGQIMGLVGPNGAGKSTIIRILLSLIRQDRGDVRVLGYPMPAQQAAAKRDIGFVSEDMRRYGYETLGWHMQFVASIYPSWDGPYAQTLLRRFNHVVASGTVDEVRSIVSRKTILCSTVVDLDLVRSWPHVVAAKRDTQRLEITAIDAESVVRKLLASDSALTNLEVRQAGLAEAFNEITKEAA